jgi:ADP-ribosylglycohydrolase
MNQQPVVDELYSHVNGGVLPNIDRIEAPTTLSKDLGPFIFNDNLQQLTLSQLQYCVSIGLAFGDSLGSSSEFFDPIRVNMILADHIQYGNWPYELRGGGKLSWGVAEPTDDTHMAMGILRGLVPTVCDTSNNRSLNFGPVADEFLKWYRSEPKDIGNLTKLVCERLEKGYGTDPFVAGCEQYLKNKNVASNGSLMRNSVVAPLFVNDTELLIDATVQQSMITHYSPLCVLVCVVESLLIQYAINHYLNKSGYEDLNKSLTFEYIQSLIQGDDSVWQQWKQKKRLVTDADNACLLWLNTVADDMSNAENVLLDGLKDFDSFDPYHFDFGDISGYCVLTLKIALWALYSSFSNENLYDKLQLQGRLPKWPFVTYKPGFHSGVAASVLVGVDADTYGAVSGGLLAAYHPTQVSQHLTDPLKVKKELQQMFNITN